jgi:hypothetical protein
VEPSFVEPAPANPADAPTALSAEQVRSWRTQGYTLVDGLFPTTLIDELQASAGAHFPEPDSQQAVEIRDFGSAVNFPSRLAGFNELTLHPRLLGAVSQLLGCDIAGLRLGQSDLWPKYGRSLTGDRYDNQDQRIHVDYPNHTLAHPSPWGRPEAVELILYLSDGDECGGSTAVVPRDGPDDPAYRWPIVDTPGVGDLRYINDRGAAEEYFAVERPKLADWRQSLYERERWTLFSPGTVVFYRHDLWHRGTPLRAGTRRLAHNLTFRRAECEWVSTLHVGWSWAMYRDDKFMERLIASSSLDQRAVLGFPQPGSSYWCDETRAGVLARYGTFGFDISPYC